MAEQIGTIAGQALALGLLSLAGLYLAFLYAARRDQEREAAGEIVSRSLSSYAPTFVRRGRAQ